MEKLLAFFKSICVTGVLLTLAVSPARGFACGWSGDGEMVLFGKADISFVPRGNGVTTDPAEMARLSVAFRKGMGVDPNREAALLWARRAAAAGHAGAMNDLAYMYETGFGGFFDEVGAVFWYRKAAALGVPEAQHSLASMLREGRGVAPSVAAADAWLRASAQAGHVTAEVELAIRIWRNEIPTQFPNEACYFWLTAIAGGYDGDGARCLSEAPELSEEQYDTLTEMAHQGTAPNELGQGHESIDAVTAY